MELNFPMTKLAKSFLIVQISLWTESSSKPVSLLEDLERVGPPLSEKLSRRHKLLACVGAEPVNEPSVGDVISVCSQMNIP